MCGIAGTFGDFDEALLSSMSRRIAHRGPDDQGELTVRGDGSEAPVGLAHRRLSIIDLSAAGHQPMSAPCDRCGVPNGAPAHRRLWLVYNGELYNFRQLREELGSQGHRFFSHSDSEVLIHLYAERGPAMLRELNGIFAFALYDGRPRGQCDGMRSRDLLVARDGLGVKPFYFSETDKGLLFASEIKALLACPDVGLELDPVALHHYLTYLWAPAPRTPLRSVRKLAPGEAMVVRAGRIAKRWFYYDIPYGRQSLLTGSDEGEIARQLGDAVSDAVQRQMVSDVPVGAFLSGGLDSSAIVAMMRRSQPGTRFPCYSIGFEGDADLDGHTADLPYARRVARHLDVDLRVITVGPEMIEHLRELIYFLDEPQADPAPINALLIARQARQDGIKVLMSGTGGDDVFAGYRRHQALLAEPLWRLLPATVRRLAARSARIALNGEGILGNMAGARMRAITRVLAHLDLPDDDRLISYFYWSGERLRRSLYAPHLRTELEHADTAEPLRQSLARIPQENHPLHRMLFLDARHFLADHNLNYADKTSMATGVEVRVPLIDRELVSFATRIPPGAKLRNGVTKAIFKKAMEPWLPREVIYRPKTGFGAPLRRWLKRELRPTVEEVLSPRSLRARGLFDPEAIQRLVDLDRMGRVDGSYTVFALICIELWCRIFLDGRGGGCA